VGKTVLARALATSLGAELSRIQGHPDLLASDVTGISVYSPETASWEFRPGPVFAHVVLCDELNRTPPRTQSALLETMEEQQVSVDGESWPYETQRFCSSIVSPMNAISLVDSPAGHRVGLGVQPHCDGNL
jgi:MoxR-like ATPase